MKNLPHEFPTLGLRRCRGCKFDQSDHDDDDMWYGEELDIISGVCFDCRRPYRIWMSKKWTLNDQYER